MKYSTALNMAKDWHSQDKGSAERARIASFLMDRDVFINVEGDMVRVRHHFDFGRVRLIGEFRA